MSCTISHTSLTHPTLYNEIGDYRNLTGVVWIRKSLEKTTCTIYSAKRLRLSRKITGRTGLKRPPLLAAPSSVAGRTVQRAALLSALPLLPASPAPQWECQPGNFSIIRSQPNPRVQPPSTKLKEHAGQLASKLTAQRAHLFSNVRIALLRCSHHQHWTEFVLGWTQREKQNEDVLDGARFDQLGFCLCKSKTHILHSSFQKWELGSREKQRSSRQSVSE